MGPAAAPAADRPSLDLIVSVHRGPGATDALRDIATAQEWFSRLLAARGRAELGEDTAVDSGRLDALRLVRGAVDQVLLGEPRASSLAVINQYDTESAPSWGLALDAQGGLVVRRRVWGSGIESWLGAVAADCIDLVRTGARERIATCASPGCDEVFLAEHHRRRYCAPGCAHRARQARYHDRHRRAWTEHDG